METSGRAHRDPLWMPVAAPVIWVLHFMACYIAAAMWCGRFAGLTPVPVQQLFVLTTTAIATAAIAALFWRALRRHQGESPGESHDADTPEDRAHFVALTTMLLAGLSALGTLFVAFGMWLVPSCS